MREEKPLWWRTGKVGWWLLSDIVNMTAYLGLFSQAMWEAICHPRKVRWREVRHYIEACGVNALPIALLICLSMGVIMGIQGSIQLQKYGQDAYLAKGVAIAIVIELGPLMCAMIAIGQAGSAFAAEIATMKVSEEISALTTMGLSPSRFLVVPKMFAMMISMPLLAVYGSVAGILGGMLIGVFYVGTPFLSYYHMTIDSIPMNFIFQCLVKSFVFGILITFVGCMRGFQAKENALGVGNAATTAVVTAIFLVILADTLMTMLFSTLFEI